MKRITEFSFSEFLSSRRVLAVLWICAVLGILIFATQQDPHPQTARWLWDMDVYWKAAQSVQHGGDPYAEGIARQVAFHYSGAPNLLSYPPMTYVYSPLTLMILRPLAMLPGWLLYALYVAALVGGFVLSAWTGWQMAEPGEKKILALLLPMTVFFPGLLTNNVFLSGNVAYILSGLMFAASVPGFKRGQWVYFYVAVLLASVCKAPLLTMLAFPVLVGRRQWVPAILTGSIGLSLFLIQPLLWPQYFAEYLQAVKLQFDWNLDFGLSPAGVLGRYLADNGLPYSPATTWCYLLFAGVAGILLLYTAIQVREHTASWQAFLPVAMMGAVLLNPRVKEYDIAALTVPMMLICWRLLRDMVRQWNPRYPRVWLTALVCVLMAGLDLFAEEIPGEWWKPCQMYLLLLVLGIGIVRCSRHREVAWIHGSATEAA